VSFSAGWSEPRSCTDVEDTGTPIDDALVVTVTGSDNEAVTGTVLESKISGDDLAFVLRDLLPADLPDGVFR